MKPYDLSVQNKILVQLKEQQASIIVYLINGYRLGGKLKDFDTFTVILEEKETQYIVYKHAISTIIPEKLLETV
ncbi:RNA chaperone Hfq [Desulfofarcimen acetoxidans]|jgi:host factor-I protein|nr:RNA chaperone Hfq [Desulfofarcimen acetoxidans]